MQRNMNVVFKAVSFQYTVQCEGQFVVITS